MTTEEQFEEQFSEMLGHASLVSQVAMQRMLRCSTLLIGHEKTDELVDHTMDMALSAVVKMIREGGDISDLTTEHIVVEHMKTFALVLLSEAIPQRLAEPDFKALGSMFGDDFELPFIEGETLLDEAKRLAGEMEAETGEWRDPLDIGVEGYNTLTDWMIQDIEQQLGDNE